MNDKNVVINSYANALTETVSDIVVTLSKLSDDMAVNKGFITIADIQITAVKSELTVLQNALDEYFGG